MFEDTEYSKDTKSPYHTLSYVNPEYMDEYQKSGQPAMFAACSDKILNSLS